MKEHTPILWTWDSHQQHLQQRNITLYTPIKTHVCVTRTTTSSTKKALPNENSTLEDVFAGPFHLLLSKAHTDVRQQMILKIYYKNVYAQFLRNKILCPPKLPVISVWLFEVFEALLTAESFCLLINAACYLYLQYAWLFVMAQNKDHWRKHRMQTVNRR